MIEDALRPFKSGTHTIKGMDVLEGKYDEKDLIKIYDGADNWRKGMSWMGVMASVTRHIEAFVSGEDIDPDLGTHHLANAAWGLMALMEFSKTHPEHDDRPHWWRQMPKIGLDIDEVLADWVGPWCALHKIDMPNSWYFDRDIMNKFERMKEDGSLGPFYMGLPTRMDPNDIPFEPHCYVTSRPVPTELTEKWLDKHGFPARPVHTVGLGESKLEVIKKSGIEVFVDDRFETFQELNNNGIVCYLMDTAHNRRYDVGERRIHTLKDLMR